MNPEKNDKPLIGLALMDGMAMRSVNSYKLVLFAQWKSH